MDLPRKPGPTHRVLLIAQAGQAVTEHRMSLKTVQDVGKVSEGSKGGSGKGQGRAGWREHHQDRNLYIEIQTERDFRDQSAASSFYQRGQAAERGSAPPNTTQVVQGRVRRKPRSALSACTEEHPSESHPLLTAYGKLKAVPTSVLAGM